MHHHYELVLVYVVLNNIIQLFVDLEMSNRRQNAIMEEYIKLQLHMHESNQQNTT